MSDIPPMPTSQAVWEVHWAFYRLTVLQRDRAWREIEFLKRALQAMACEEDNG